MSDRLVTLHDGRELGLTAFGDPAVERLVLFCHPVPGAGGFDPDPRLTSSWGVHLVSFDRPGYGASTPLPETTRPSIARYADDLAEYVVRVVEQARQTGRTPLGKVGVVGWSGGGRVALALAGRHPNLVDRVAVVATPAPDSAVPWVPQDLQEMTRRLLAMPVAEAKAQLRTALEAQPRGVQQLADGEADLATLDRQGLRGRLTRMLDNAYAQGTVGVADDLLSYAEDDWGFDLGDVRAETLLVYGAKDPLIGSAHGRWYRRHLPHAHLTVVPRSGHLVVTEGWRQVLEHVDPQHGTRGTV